MNQLSYVVVLVLVAGSWAQMNMQRAMCDSPESEEAALVALDYLNGQHTHGYKYALNRIEDVKVFSRPDGNSTYVLEIDLLETDCHVLDPTPVANCTVRPKILTAIEGDCDVVLDKVSGVLTVTAFKCKTEESTEDLCVGCHSLLPLNHTVALDFVHASLATFNNNTENQTFALLEVGRMTSQIVSGGPLYTAEYVVVEANCTEDQCTPLNDTMAARGFCTAKGVSVDHSVDCKMFSPLMPVFEDNNATVQPLPPAVHVHSLSHKHGLKYHRLTHFHDPQMSGFLSAESSAESAESSEVVAVSPTATAAITVSAVDAVPVADSASAMETPDSKEVLSVFKRDVANAAQTEPSTLIQLCPGAVRFF